MRPLIIFFVLLFCLSTVYASEVKVSLTDSGFSPDSIEIEKGTTVTWVNEGKKPHWPASNFHPTHDAYPVVGGCMGSKLDSCRGISPGETFSFKFDESGTWGMHDHIYPGYTMVVIVKGASAQPLFTEKKQSFWEAILSFFGFKPKKAPELALSTGAMAKLAYQRCSNPDNTKIIGKLGCYAREMENVSFKNGRVEAYKVLFEIQKMDQGTLGCHLLAHGIGWGVYKRNSSNFQNDIRTSNPICSYGELMGIIEEYVQNLPGGRLKKEDVPGLCGKDPRPDCTHAVGHMIMLGERGNLTRSIDYCSALKNPAQNLDCLTGAFMERIVSTNLVEHGIVPPSWSDSGARINNSKKLCLSLKGQLALACWREMAHPAAYYFRSDPKKVFDFCNTAQSRADADICKIHSYQEIISVMKFNMTKLGESCTLQRDFDPSFEGRCIREIVRLKVYTFGVTRSADAVDYCNTVDPKFSKICFSVIGDTLQTMHTKIVDSEKMCATAPDSFKDFCVKGTGQTVMEQTVDQ